jgi:hypothetical protein
MNKAIKILGLMFFLSFAVVACNDDKKDCDEDCKKECCEDKDKKECAEDCKKECCKDKDKEKKACEPGCEKECCKGGDSDSTAAPADTTAAPVGDEDAHTCTRACKDDPDSCPHHAG